MAHCRRSRLWMAGVLGLGLLTACSVLPTQPPSPSPEPPTALPATPTAPLPPTAASLPTVTPLPAPTEPPVPGPTSVAATAAASEQAEALAAIAPDLKRYGFAAEDGTLGWQQGPMTLELTEYLEDQISVEFDDLSVRDFVVQADITWTSTSGLAGCGFVVRYNPRVKADYRWLSLRASGEPVWIFWIFENGKFLNSPAGLRDAPSLNLEQDSTNTVALIGEGSRFTAYINGVDAGNITDTRLREGAVGFAASHESGKTICTFDNAWLWIPG